jgi:hypothetical protein
MWRMYSGTVGQPAASGPPAALALDCSTGQRTSARAASAGGQAGTRRPSVPASVAHASGKRPRGWAAAR